MVGAGTKRDDPVVSGSDDDQLLRALTLAIDGFAVRLRAVGDDWARPTPCTEWDVRALVNHVVGANVRYELLLRGAPLADVEATRSLDHLGDDAVAAFATTARVMVVCFRDASVLDRTFRHVAGERTGRELLAMRVFDIGVHTWDLAVAIGADRCIDADVVAVALGTGLPANDDAHDGNDTDLSAQDRLLLRSGRHPHEEVER